MYTKTCHSKRIQKLTFNTDDRLMQVKSIAECSNRDHSAILLTFIKLPFCIKTFVLPIDKWPLKTGFTVHVTVSKIYKAKCGYPDETALFSPIKVVPFKNSKFSKISNTSCLPKRPRQTGQTRPDKTASDGAV